MKKIDWSPRGDTVICENSAFCCNSNFSQGGMHFATQNAPLLNYIRIFSTKFNKMELLANKLSKFRFNQVCSKDRPGMIFNILHFVTNFIHLTLSPL